jgi:hypothetical protein
MGESVDQARVAAKTSSTEDPREMLELLLALFPNEKLHSGIHFELIPPEQLQPRYSHLLDHNDHLTKIMQQFHGGLDVTVLESACAGNFYSRRTLLQAPDSTPVAYAVLQADLKNLPAAVKEGIEGETIPFGQLLMDHVHTRCVLLKACWKVRVGEALQKVIGLPVHQNGHTYARTIVIMCDGQEAAEVLEIVV